MAFFLNQICSRHLQCQWRKRSRRQAVSELNPQNVPDPKVMPSKEYSAEQTVRIQLDALKNNDQPWPNHGIQTAYEFGEDIGGMERSRYFGYSKDLYHFDHFLGQFQNAFPLLVDLDEYTVESIQQSVEDSAEVAVHVTKRGSKARYCFWLVRKDIGRKKGALMTKSLKALLD